jgi:excisionase family DNA binding protein
MRSKKKKSSFSVVIPNPQSILTGEQVATQLQISPDTVYELTRRRCRNPLPFIKVGKYLRFRWSDVERWLDDGKVAA